MTCLRTDVHRFRHAIDAAFPDLRGDIVFGCFPRGCCRDASELLAHFLQLQGHGEFILVCGFYYPDKTPWSHAWLERAGCIVDITRDQFEDNKEPTFVTDDRRWHDGKFYDQTEQKKSDYDEWSGALRGPWKHIMKYTQDEAGKE